MKTVVSALLGLLFAFAPPAQAAAHAKANEPAAIEKVATVEGVTEYR
ncbi:MAG: hypothetical protein HYU75_21095, partial [Betaproteobacteria bacterium]|nr:hypothetical protein [Betaproteobacteria bacterium]